MYTFSQKILIKLHRRKYALSRTDIAKVTKKKIKETKECVLKDLHFPFCVCFVCIFIRFSSTSSQMYNEPYLIVMCASGRVKFICLFCICTHKLNTLIDRSGSWKMYLPFVPFHTCNFNLNALRIWLILMHSIVTFSIKLYW